MPGTATTRFEAIHADIRDEIKKRIDQRDKYSIQLTIAIAAVYGLAFSGLGRPVDVNPTPPGAPGTAAYSMVGVLFAAPLASFYFTVLILYSYTIHDVLARYLHDVVEPRLAASFGHSPDEEWERYYKTQRRPGIRRQFFLIMHWVVTLMTCVIVFALDGAKSADAAWRYGLIAIVLVTLSAIVMRPAFWHLSRVGILNNILRWRGGTSA